MSLEYFRPECQRPLDADGYEIDSATREIAEIDAWLAEQAKHAAPAPIRGGSPFEPTAADWDDMARWCEWCDRNDEIRRDQDRDEADAEARARYGL